MAGECVPASAARLAGLLCECDCDCVSELWLCDQTSCLHCVSGQCVWERERERESSLPGCCGCLGVTGSVFLMTTYLTKLSRVCVRQLCACVVLFVWPCAHVNSLSSVLGLVCECLEPWALLFRVSNE